MPFDPAPGTLQERLFGGELFALLDFVLALAIAVAALLLARGGYAVAAARDGGHGREAGKSTIRFALLGLAVVIGVRLAAEAIRRGALDGGWPA